MVNLGQDDKAIEINDASIIKGRWGEEWKITVVLHTACVSLYWAMKNSLVNITRDIHKNYNKKEKK